MQGFGKYMITLKLKMDKKVGMTLSSFCGEVLLYKPSNESVIFILPSNHGGLGKVHPLLRLVIDSF